MAKKKAATPKASKPKAKSMNSLTVARDKSNGYNSLTVKRTKNV